MASTDEDTHDDDPEKRVLTNEDIREFSQNQQKQKNLQKEQNVMP